MDIISRALAMSPEMQAAFKKAERARERQAERDRQRADGADNRIAAAEAKRERRRQRNLANSAAW